MLTASGTFWQVEDHNPSLRMRRLAETASPAPIDYSPTWELPSLDPTQARPSRTASSVHNLPEVMTCQISASSLLLSPLKLAVCWHVMCASGICQCLW